MSHDDTSNSGADGVSATVPLRDLRNAHANVTVAETKPQVPLRPLFSTHPAKNYAYHLLALHAAELKPNKVLDAGCGKLRNLRHFSGGYVGITLQAMFYFSGLERPENQDWIRTHGQPLAYIVPLESDFSSVGAFDLCICTNTLSCVETKKDIVTRLAERVNTQGSLIVSDERESLPDVLDALSPAFTSLTLIYYGSERTNRFEPDSSTSFALSLEEMNASNTPAGHSHFYVLATGKKFEASPSAPSLKIPLRGNLYVIQNTQL